jgi:hypothetical protein
MQDVAQSIKEKVNKLIGRAGKDAGNFDAVPGGPNRHGQGDASPPPDKAAKVKYAGLHTAPDTAFFWSGKTNGVGVMNRAAEVAEVRGGTTQEMLLKKNGIREPVGKFDDPHVVKFWEDVSTEYAKGVSGKVRVVLGEEVRPNSV